MKHKLLETGKLILIGLLLLSTMLLTVMTLPEQTVRSVAPLRFAAQKLGLLDDEDTFVPAPVQTPAAQPLLISINVEAGRHTVRGEFAALDAACARFGGFLGKALATADEPTAVTEDVFLDALRANSVLFSYRGSIPVDAAACWLGADACPLSGLAGDFLLQCGEDGVRLIVRGDGCTAYATQLSAALLAGEMAGYPPDGSVFFCELPEGGGFDPLMLWTQEIVTLPAAAASNPVTPASAALLASALEFNPYGAGAYTDPDGSAVYTESGRTCVVSHDGRVELSVTDESFSGYAAADDSPAARAEVACRVLAAVCDGRIGDARLYLVDYTQDGENVVCRFDYCLDGIPVPAQEAVVQFRGTLLTSLTVTLREYRRVPGTLTLMPMTQLAAISPAGSRLCPAYSDAGSSSLLAGWTRT